jgi:hypothetical protein
MNEMGSLRRELMRAIDALERAIGTTLGRRRMDASEIRHDLAMARASINMAENALDDMDHNLQR